MPTPVSIVELQQILHGYDKDRQAYLIHGFTYGFRIGCFGVPPRDNTQVGNLKSAGEFSGVIDRKLSKELVMGRILGPYTIPPALAKFRVSPLGVVPKKAKGEFRMIHHLSYPEGESVNDFIPDEMSSVTYATIQDAISFIQCSRQPVYMAKVDIESAFRIIPVSPADRPLLGFQWKGQYFMDAVLPMGCCSSPAIFERFSTALEWAALNKLEVTAMVHVLDDFLLLAHTATKCQRDLTAFINLCHNLAVPLAHSKTVGPSSSITFLGITLDAVRMEARLPEDKLVKARSLLLAFLNKSKVTLRELQMLVGFLNFACSVVVPGRAFLRRLIDLTIGIQQPHHRVRLTRQAKLDLGVWLEFLSNFNGRSFFLATRFLTGDVLQLFTDAAGGVGYGALCGSAWFHGRWPEAWRLFSVSVLELYPIMAAVVVWSDSWANKNVCFFTDHESLVPIINNQTSRDPNIMALLRPLVLTCLRFNINFTARHIPGRYNILADKLSRSQVEEFRVLAPWAHTRPTEVPYHASPAGLGSL